MAQGWKSAFVRFAEWFSRLAYINVLWIGFTLLGLILFGFIPATVSMFAVVRKWHRGNLEDSVFKTFWSYYRNEFVKSNISGLVLLVIGYVLYLDIFVLVLDQSMPMQVVQFLLYILGALFLLVTAFFFPVYVHFELKWYQYLKIATLMVFAAPLRAIIMLIIGYGVFFLMAKMPILMFFFLGSIISYLWQMISLPTFDKIQDRK